MSTVGCVDVSKEYGATRSLKADAQAWSPLEVGNDAGLFGEISKGRRLGASGEVGDFFANVRACREDVDQASVGALKLQLLLVVEWSSCWSVEKVEQ